MKIAFKLTITFLWVFAACKNENNQKAELTEMKKTGLSTIILTDLNQQAINIEKYKGKTVFINFWATWCKPCIQEMPSIANLQKILRDENIVFLLASDETIENIDNFRSRHDYKFNYTRIENSEELTIQALPTTHIYSPDGSLAFSEAGDRQWDDVVNVDMIRNIIKSND